MDKTATFPGPGDDSDARLPLGGLLDLLGVHLRLAHVAVYRDFADAMADLDLTQKQYAMLYLIGAKPAVSQVDIAGALGADRATTMAMVDRLEQRGFLTRTRSLSDRRRQELNLTPEGAAALKRAGQIIADHERRFTSRFTEVELEVLTKALSRIHRQG